MIRFLTLCVVLILVSGCNVRLSSTGQPQKAKVVPTGPAVKVSLWKLRLDYEENEVAADVAYKDKWLEVDCFQCADFPLEPGPGVTQYLHWSVTKTKNGNNVLIPTIMIASRFEPGCYCRFSDPAPLAKLPSDAPPDDTKYLGGSFVVRGICTGYDKDPDPSSRRPVVVLTDCSFVRMPQLLSYADLKKKK